MKHCELCGLENPDEARFCMKCGKDLDSVRLSDIPPEIIESDAFTPAGSSGATPSVAPRQEEPGPLPDIQSYKEAATSRVESEEVLIPVEYDDEPPEIRMTDVTSDFTEKKTVCNQCGVANPPMQRHCKHCGADLRPDTTDQRSGPGDTFGQAAPPASAPVETTMLADFVPSSDYRGSDAAAVTYREPRGLSFTGGPADWGVREWLLSVIAALVATGLIWFFAFGGMNMIFNSEAKNLRKASQTMSSMAGFQCNLTATLEDPDADYAGNGQVVYEAPDKTAWQLHLNLPGRGPVLLQHVQIGDDSYTNCGASWQVSDKGEDTSVTGLWSGSSTIEDLGNETMHGHSCFHYKYRTSFRLITTVLCAGEQPSVSDAVVEAWIDKDSFQIIRTKAEVFNVRIENKRTKATLLLDLGVANQSFGVKAPI